MAALAFVGHGLSRPECVLATRAGDLFTADWRGTGGVAHIRADGTQALYAASSLDLAGALRPNGIALEADGSFLCAHLGEDDGGVWRLSRDGQCRPLLQAVDGVALPPTNFVLRDANRRLWVTVSTRVRPRRADWRGDASSGFIVLDDGRGPRIVADGLGYANECAPDPNGWFLYVNETYGRRLSRFPITADGLGPRETVCAFGAGTFPDGLAFDTQGAVWVVSIISNRVIRIDPSTGAHTLFHEDSDPAHLAAVEAAYLAGGLDRAHVDARGGRLLHNISSIAFGGAGLRTLHLGALGGDRIACMPAPVAGHPPPHWLF